MARSSPCPEAALRGQPGGRTSGVRWLVAVVPSSPAVSRPEPGPGATPAGATAPPASSSSEQSQPPVLLRGCWRGERKHAPALGGAGQSAPCSGQQVLGSGGQQEGAGQQSSHQPQPGATPPAHTACPGPPAYLEASQAAGTGRAPRGAAQPSCALAASGPLPGDHSPQAPAWGGWGPGRRLAGPPREGRGPSQPPAPPGQRSDTMCSVTLSYSWESLSTLIIPGYRLKYLFCHKVSLGCVGPFLCLLC